MQFVNGLDPNERVFLVATFQLVIKVVVELNNVDLFVRSGVHSASPKHEWQVGLNRLETQTFEHSNEVSSLDLALVLKIIDCHRLVKRMVSASVVQNCFNLCEHLVLDQVKKRLASVHNVSIQSGDELVVRNEAIFVGIDQAHKIIDFVVLYAYLQSCKTSAKVLLGDLAVSMHVKNLEGFLQIEVLQEESCRNLVECLVHANCPEGLRLKSVAEEFEVHFANLVGVCNSAHHSVVLHRKGVQVQFTHELFELLHADNVGLSKRVVALLERVIERHLAVAEHVDDLFNQSSFSLQLLGLDVVFGLDLLDLGIQLDLLTLCVLLLGIQLQTVLLLCLFLSNVSQPHFVNDVAKCFLEEVHLDKVALNVDSLIAFADLFLTLRTSDCEHSQVLDAGLRHVRANTTHGDLELSARDNLTLVSRLPISKLTSDVLLHLGHDLLDLLQNLEVFKNACRNYPLADIELGSNRLCVGNLLCQVISVDIAVRRLISMQAEELKVLFLDGVVKELNNFTEIFIGDEPACFLREDIEDAQDIVALMNCMLVDLAQQVLVVLQRVGCALLPQLELVYTALFLVAALQEDLHEVVVINKVIVIQALKLVLKSNQRLLRKHAFRELVLEDVN